MCTFRFVHLRIAQSIKTYLDVFNFSLLCPCLLQAPFTAPAAETLADAGAVR